MLERAGELAVLDSLLDAAGGGAGGLAIVEGPAGIGKTELLRAAALRARELGVTVLTASGDHLEREFPFGVVRGLLESLLAGASSERRGVLLAGAAGLASSALGLELRGELAGARSETSFAAVHGLYWLTWNLAAEGPVLIVVDDAHWADVGTLRWLAYLTRRLEELPILLVLAARPGEPGADAELLAAISDHPSARMIRPAPLSEAATGRLIGEALGAEAEREFARSCQSATGGNPFLVRQLASALVADGVPPHASEARRVGQLGPGAVARALVLRLARLPPAASALAQAVAVLGGGVDLRMAGSLAGCDPAAAVEGFDALARVEILADARPLRFVHPIVQMAVYDDMGAGHRAGAHARAARLLKEAGAEPARIATHLLATGPAADPWVTETLRAAARDARERGAPEAAVTYLRRALDEPRPADARAEVLFELGVAEMGAMALPEAIGHLEEAIAANDDPAAQARAALVLTPVLFATGQATAAVELMDRLIASLGDADRELAETLEAVLINVARIELGARRLVMDRISLDAEGIRDDTLGGKTLLANLAVETIIAGLPASTAAEFAQRALAGGVLAAGEGGDVPSLFLATVRALTMTDRLELAAPLLEDALADGRARGSVLTFATASAFRSELAYRRGDLAVAEADARATLDIALETGWQIGLPACVAYVIDALIERGELTEAAEIVERCGLGGELPSFVTSITLLDSRGRLRIAAGDAQAGLADLRECGRLMEAWGDRNTIHWRSSAALALAGLGQAEEARQLAREELGFARVFGAPRPLGIALRACGLVEGGDDGLALLHEAVAVLEGSGIRLEQARALIDLGAALRRDGQRRAAREPLRRGLDLAHRCGATVLAERAREELAAAGARPRRPLLTGRDSLTASERRIAQMASTGLSNRDIAQALFVTVRTVETHLSRTYLKLDLHSREGLAAALTDEGDAVVDERALPGEPERPAKRHSL